MSNKFTPGPWAYDGAGVITNDKWKIIADVQWDLKLSFNEGTANLTLIAAAPDLLEALRSAKALLSAQGINENSRIGGFQFSMIKTAIEKATTV